MIFLHQGIKHRVSEAVGAEAIGVTTASVSKLYCYPTQMRGGGLPILIKKDLRSDQVEDPLCGLTLRALQSGH